MSPSNICDNLVDQIVDDVTDCSIDPYDPSYPVILPSYTTDYDQNYDSDTCYSIVEQLEDFGDERYSASGDSCATARDLFSSYKTYQL